MTIIRDDVAAYLESQFSGLAAAVGQADSSADNSGYGADIDGALRKLGKTESELETATIEDGGRDAYFALAEYYAARRFWRQLSHLVNHRIGDSQFDYKGMMANVKMVADDAKTQAISLGYDVAGGGWSVGWLNLDFLEPALE